YFNKPQSLSSRLRKECEDVTKAKHLRSGNLNDAVISSHAHRLHYRGKIIRHHGLNPGREKSLRNENQPRRILRDPRQHQHFPHQHGPVGTYYLWSYYDGVRVLQQQIVGNAFGPKEIRPMAGRSTKRGNLYNSRIADGATTIYDSACQFDVNPIETLRTGSVNRPNAVDQDIRLP